MQEFEAEKELIPTFRCSFGNEADLVCITESCMICPFICSEKLCQCSRKQHYECGQTKWLNIVERVQAKRANTTIQFQEFSDSVEKIFNEVL